MILIIERSPICTTKYTVYTADIIEKKHLYLYHSTIDRMLLGYFIKSYTRHDSN